MVLTHSHIVKNAALFPEWFPRDIWCKESADLRRAYLIMTLRDAPAGIDTHLMDLAIKVGEKGKCSIPSKWLTTRAFHDSKYRRMITEDIRAINTDIEYEGIYIMSGFYGVRIVGGDDLVKLLEKKRAKALKILRDVRLISKKVGLDGQIEIDPEGEYEDD